MKTLLKVPLDGHLPSLQITLPKEGDSATAETRAGQAGAQGSGLEGAGDNAVELRGADKVEVSQAPVGSGKELSQRLKVPPLQGVNRLPDPPVLFQNMADPRGDPLRKPSAVSLEKLPRELSQALDGGIVPLEEGDSLFALLSAGVVGRSGEFPLSPGVDHKQGDSFGPPGNGPVFGVSTVQKEGLSAPS